MVKLIVGQLLGIVLALVLVWVGLRVALWRQRKRFEREDRQHRKLCVARFDAEVAKQGLYWNEGKQTYEYQYKGLSGA